MVLWFGLDRQGQRTMEQIAHQLGGTKQAVKQMLDRALKRLRAAGDRLGLDADEAGDDAA